MHHEKNLAIERLEVQDTVQMSEEWVLTAYEKTPRKKEIAPLSSPSQLE